MNKITSELKKIEEELINKLDNDIRAFIEPVTSAKPTVTKQTVAIKTPAKTKAIVKQPPKVKLPPTFDTKASFIAEWIKTMKNKNAGAQLKGFLSNKSTMDQKAIGRYWQQYNNMNLAGKQSFFT